MRLILKENSFQFNGKHYLQTHGIAMGSKMAVAFAVIFMAHIEKQLLASSPHKPIIWKRFIDDIFSVWTINENEINDFVLFANSFHPTIKFTCEMSSQRIVFLDTEVFKGPRFAEGKILDVETHFKPNKLFNTRIPFHATLSENKLSGNKIRVTQVGFRVPFTSPRLPPETH